MLDLTLPVDVLVRRLVDFPSESGSEGPLADDVESALHSLPHLDVLRDGDTLVARTSAGRGQRVALAGHLDTVPAAGNLPARVEDDVLHGLGSADMKGGVAVMLRLAATVAEPRVDVTYVFYECEEVDATRNGLGRLARTRPELLAADFAVLLEPTGAVVEGGCQGTLRVEVRTAGRRAHSARSWLGSNAIHAAAPLLHTLAEYRPRSVVVEGLEYREGLSAVSIAGGVAGNVVPDSCVVTVNHRFAPDRSEAQALEHVRGVLDGFDVTLVDTAPAAAPGLDRPVAAAFLEAIGGSPRAKYGWTDVARFATLGIPAVNYGPGDPSLAHTAEEHVPLAQVREVEERLAAWLR